MPNERPCDKCGTGQPAFALCEACWIKHFGGSPAAVADAIAQATRELRERVEWLELTQRALLRDRDDDEPLLVHACNLEYFEKAAEVRIDPVNGTIVETLELRAVLGVAEAAAAKEDK